MVELAFRKKQMEKDGAGQREQLAAATPGEWVRTRRFLGPFRRPRRRHCRPRDDRRVTEMYWERETRPAASRQWPGTTRRPTAPKTEEISDEDEAILGWKRRTVANGTKTRCA